MVRVVFFLDGVGLDGGGFVGMVVGVSVYLIFLEKLEIWVFE